MKTEEKDQEKKVKTHQHGFLKRKPETSEDYFKDVRLASAKRIQKRLHGRVRVLARDLD